MNAEKELRETYNFGKWEQESFEFAGTYLHQDPDGMIHLDQDDYVTKWLEEVELDPRRKQQKKSSLTANEVTKLRAALGTLSWRATQSAPQFLADVSLLLSEVNISTVETVEKVNKLVREVRRTSKQRLSFHCWKADLRDLSVVVWADASNHNRPDKSSTMGIIAGVAPKTILNGSEEAISVIQWKSSKTPRQCLGSNGAEGSRSERTWCSTSEPCLQSSEASSWSATRCSRRSEMRQLVPSSWIRGESMTQRLATCRRCMASEKAELAMNLHWQSTRRP